MKLEITPAQHRWDDRYREPGLMAAAQTEAITRDVDVIRLMMLGTTQSVIEAPKKKDRQSEP